MGCGAGNHRRGSGGGGEPGQKSRRAVGTGGRLAGLRLRLRLRLAGWLLYSIFIGHARGSNSGRLACEATCGTTWAY
jgi:hypothetical protein